MKIDESTTRAELAAIVCEALRQDEIHAVLVGGSVAAIYTHELFPSDDLDFAAWADLRKLRLTLERLGFNRFVGRTAYHPSTKFFVDFVNPPVAIGAKFDVKPVELTTSLGTLRLLSPLDSALDRLRSFLNDGDRPSLLQTLEIAVAHHVSLNDIKSWFAKEPTNTRANERFAEFCERLVEKMGRR